MPVNNSFRHQVYSAEPPAASYRLIQAAEHEMCDVAQLRLGSDAVSYLKAAGFQASIFVHGTFTGDDALGLVREVGRVSGKMSDFLRESGKRFVDELAGETGNYSVDFETTVRRLFANHQLPCRVERHLWSGENHHRGRAEAAVGLADRILAHAQSERSRILLLGHSHAGNVFALLTHLFGGTDDDRDRFFDATRELAESDSEPPPGSVSWNGVRLRLANEQLRRSVRLSIVTFGTPIRYGWETNGYDDLLHIVHHRAVADRPVFAAEFPFSWDELKEAENGDYVQQIGIAGTDLLPYLFSRRSWRTERRLDRLLESEVRRRDLFRNLHFGQRVADEGQTLLVDYPKTAEKLEQQLFGHGVYTRLEWLPYHFRLLTEHLRGS